MEARGVSRGFGAQVLGQGNGVKKGQDGGGHWRMVRGSKDWEEKEEWIGSHGIRG